MDANVQQVAPQPAVMSVPASVAVKPADKIRTAIVDLFTSTERQADRSGMARAKGLLKLFTKPDGTQEDVKDALDTEGIDKKSATYFALSNSKTFWRAYTENIKGWDAETVKLADGTESGSWKARLAFAREGLKQAAERRHMERLKGSAYVTASMTLGTENPAEVVAAAIKVERDMLAAEQAKADAKLAERESPERQAQNAVARFLKDDDKGLTFAVKYAEAFSAAVREAVKADALANQEANRNAEKAERIAEERKAA